MTQKKHLPHTVLLTIIGMQEVQGHTVEYLLLKNESSETFFSIDFFLYFLCLV